MFKKIGNRAFCGCSALANITIPDGVTEIGDGAFWGCSGLAEHGFIVIRGVLHGYSGTDPIADIPDNVTRIGAKAFKDCVSLTSITIPDSVTSFGDKAFIGCEKLASITLPKGFPGAALKWMLPQTNGMIIIHNADISDISVKYRPGAAVGFAEDGRDCTDENSKAYLKYIKKVHQEQCAEADESGITIPRAASSDDP